MTATATLPNLRAFGFDTDRPADWRGAAACAGRWEDFTEQLLPTNGHIPPTSRLAIAAHLCQHCPVLLQCTLQAETPGKRPQEMVQAGLWWPSIAHRPPRALPDPGCGPHCAHLRRQR